VTLHQGDARDVLGSIRPDRPFDFAFLDATKEQSEAYLDAILPLLAPRYLIVTDNTTTHAEELASFVDRLRRIPAGASCHVAVGNGFELTVGRIG
jgi:predicted O-methyltransferase YrrM